MPNWKKVITSGSTAVLNEITSSGGIFSAEDIYSRESKLGRDTYLERELVLGTEPSLDTTTDTSIVFLTRNDSSGIVQYHKLGSNAFNSTAFTSCTGTVTGTGANNRVATWNGTTSLDGSSNFTYDGTTLNLSYTGTGDLLRLTSTDAGAASAPDLTFCRDSASPADDDTLGTIQFYGEVSGTSVCKNYASIYGRIACATNGQTKGNLSFKAECNNVFVDTANFSPNGLYVMPPDDFAITSPGIGLTVTGAISGSGKLYIGSADTNTSSTSALVLNGTEVEKRTLGTNAFNSTAFTTCTGDITQVCVTAGDGLTGDVNTTSGAHLQTIDVDSTVVRTSGNQTIGGTKTFNSSATFAGGFTSDDPVTFDSDITVTGISTTFCHDEALVIDGTGGVYSRTLGTNAFNSTAFTTCTGTTTPSNTQTFTNKSGNISQWTNDSGYITDGNTNWTNLYGYTTCTGTTTPSNTQTFTNKSGNISQWTNDSGYTSCTGTVTAASGVDNRVAVFSGATGLDASGNFTYDGGSSLLIKGRMILGGTHYNAGTCTSILGGTSNCIYSCADYAVVVGGDTNHNCGRTSFIGAGSNNYVRACANFVGGGYYNRIGDDTSSGNSNCSSVIVGGVGNFVNGGTTTTNACVGNFIGGGMSNTIQCTAKSTIAGGQSNCIAGSNGYSVIAGGQTNCIGGQHSFVGGGSANTMNANYSTLGGGASNCIQGGSYNFLGGGQSNKIQGCTDNTIGGGSSNEVVVTSYGNSNFIGGGIQNKICGTNNSYATVTGGWCNSICSSYCSTIGGGRSNCVTSQHLSTIGGGGSNYVCGRASTITGGENNRICNNTCGCASILGGCNNMICTAKFASAVGLLNTVHHDCSHAIGAGLTSTTTRTTYMNNTTVACHLQVGGTTTMSTTIGRIDATNDIVAYATSDRRLKENIQPINNALCKVVGVSGNTFIWKELSEQEVKDIHGNTGNDVGVIAQEIESILPEAVTTRDNGYKAVNYEKIVPLLIEAIKEQQKQIDELKSKV